MPRLGFRPHPAFRVARRFFARAHVCCDVRQCRIREGLAPGSSRARLIAFHAQLLQWNERNATERVERDGTSGTRWNAECQARFSVDLARRIWLPGQCPTWG